MWGAVYQAALWLVLVYGCPTHQKRCDSLMDGRMAASGLMFDAAVGACRLT